MASPIVEPLVTTPKPSANVSRLIAGRRLRIAKLVWWLCLMLVIVMTLAALPLNASLLRQPCDGSGCNSQQHLTLAQVETLAQAGISLDTLVTLLVVVSLIPTLAYLGIAVLLFQRMANDKVAYLTSLGLMLYGGVSYSDFVQQLAVSEPVWVIPFLILSYAGTLLMVAFFYFFPTGIFMPRWLRWLFAVWIVEEALDTVSVPPLNLQLLPELVINASIVLIVSSALLAQIYRFARISTPAERQQTKWVLLGVSIALGTLLLLGNLSLAGWITSDNILISLAINYVLAVTISALPLSMGIALLRSHLWNVDLIINRTIVYGTLTAILAGVLSVTSDLSKNFFLAITGKSSDLAPMLATLVVVATFDPLRKGLQRFVDQHFKYATRSYGEFGEEIEKFLALNDPEELAYRFLRESIETFDASGGAVYLGQGAQLRLVKTQGDWSGHAELAVPLEYVGSNVGLIALGARKNGEAYVSADRTNLQQMGELVAHAIRLAPVAVELGERNASHR